MTPAGTIALLEAIIIMSASLDYPSLVKWLSRFDTPGQALADAETYWDSPAT